MTTTTRSVTEFVSDLKTDMNYDSEFNFSILCEQQPIKNAYDYVYKVIAIIVKIISLNTVQYIHYDQIDKMGFNYIKVKDTVRRKLGVRKHPFFIDGSSVINNI